MNAAQPVRRVPFPLLDQRPAVLDGVLLDFHWDLERLHSLVLPERDVETASLLWHLGLPFWSAGGSPFRASPFDVASEPSAHPEQWERTMSADLGYPLETYERDDGCLVILDGVLRLLKARIEGRPVLRARVLAVEDFDAIAVIDADGGN
ncbi:hypothetical protein [Brachybacterium sp. ACRRE]|uniref:hypothetical protein n=1 Tax=Brachybacterium sp. ACRRE TaxID=2918184 RepID=UPI001EF26209|nr:hypothetical protein [Brachybacterium sp. ACRRE]MCG7310333.1 hypothetical protein [Brachybacterium sp. ACRRE]